MMTSQRSQPSASISARLGGRKPAGRTPAGSRPKLENKGVAVCTPAIRPDPSPYVDGNIDLGVFALNQQRDAVAGPGDFSLQFRHRRDARSVDPQDHVARLQSGGQRRALDIFDEQPAPRVHLLLLLRVELANRQAQFAAGVLALVAGSLGGLVIQQYGFDIHLAALVIAPVADVRLAAGRNLGDDARQVVGLVDVVAIDHGDDVAGLQAGPLAGAFRLHGADESAVRRTQTERRSQLLIHRLHGHPDAAAAYLALGEQLILDVKREVDRNREGDAHVAARTAVYLGIDADDFAVHIE